MDWLPSAITWLISTLVGAAMGYAAIKAMLTNHATRIAMLEQEVGTRNTGIRGAVHDHQNEIIKINSRLSALERK